MTLVLGVVLGIVLATLLLLAVVRSGSAGRGAGSFASRLRNWLRSLGFGGPLEPSWEEEMRWLREHEDEATPLPPLPTAPAPPEVPEGFHLRVEAGAAAVPVVRLQRLDVDAGGRVAFEHLAGPDDRSPLRHTFYLSDFGLDLLTRTMRSGGAMDAVGGSAKMVDGDYLVVSMRMEGREHRVALVGTHDPAVTDLVRTLNGLLPETMRISYSLLDGPEPPLPGGVAWP